MIVPRSPQIRRMVEYVGRPLLVLFGYDLVVVVAYKVMHWDWVALPHVPLALFGSAIGLILGFRNNSAYDRWWEARKLWGVIVNNSRSWARLAVSTIASHDASEAEEVQTMQRRLVYHQIAYVHAVRQHLRGLAPWEELAPLLREEEISALQFEKNIPLALQVQMGKLVQECQQRGWINDLQWSQMNTNMDDLADAQGGCERIKNTPMPKQYDYFPKLFVEIYCLVLPLTLVLNMQWYTPLGSTLVGFIFLALDKIGRDMEDPFDNTIYDVPLTSISRNIEINLRQILGEETLPAAEVAVRGVLW
jgi:ion channel-forming bestrophin family protein